MAEKTYRTTDTVRMEKDGIEGTATAVRSAFEKVWKPKGWTLVEEGAVTKQEATGTSAKTETKTETKTQTER